MYAQIHEPPPAFTLISCSAYFPALKMEAICSAETSIDFQQTAWRYIPEDGTLQIYEGFEQGMPLLVPLVP
jgi:hypothetical protein